MTDMEKTGKSELLVAALENGTVIDHIPSDKVFDVVNLLGQEGYHQDCRQVFLRGGMQQTVGGGPEYSSQHNPRLRGD